MEEIKQEFIPLPDTETNEVLGEAVRSGKEPADPLPSRMTREYSEFLHRFDDVDSTESYTRIGSFPGGTDSFSGETEEDRDAGLPVEVIAGPDDLEAAVEYAGSGPYSGIDFSAKQYGNAVDDNNPTEEILDSGSFRLSDNAPGE